MHVEPGHPDANSPLLAHAARVLEHMGAEVVIHTHDDNLVRSRLAGDPGEAAYIVEAAGLPNLLHELVHVLLVDRLADDHGLDYGQIPYDLEVAAQRRILWDELCCCTVSCAYLGQDAQAGWFAEQVGIQGVFYGHDDDPEGFLRRVERTIAEHGHELEVVIAGAYRVVESRLRAVGAPPALARPRARLDFAALWTRFRARS